MSLTELGGAVGTAAYMSPEQLDGRAAIGASDQYALGVIAYELIAGRRPFYGSAAALIEAHRAEVPPPLSRWRPDRTSYYDDAIARMLAKEPDHRFHDIAHALEALRAKPLPAGDPQRAALRALMTTEV
jgi:serine/threonine-protein kinase